MITPGMQNREVNLTEISSGSSQLKGGRQAQEQAIIRHLRDTEIESCVGQHRAPGRENLAHLWEELRLGICGGVS